MRLPLLVIHITAGIIGILSGTAAIAFRKGSPRHAQAGKIFVAAMLTMAAAAVCLAYLKQDYNNIGGGVLTFYLIGTAWLTARRKDGETKVYDWAILLIPLAIGVGGWINGLQALHSPSGEKYGVPGGMHLFLGSVCLLAAVGDIRMLLRGGVFGLQRISRHLWRMCFGLFIATGSFFLGQGMKVFPAFVVNSGVLFIPAVLPLLLLIFWMIRVRFTHSYNRMATLRGSSIRNSLAE